MTLYREIHESVVGELQSESDVNEVVRSTVSQQYPLLPQKQQDSIISRVLNEVRGYGFLEDLLARDDVNEIMINSHDQIFIDASGVMEKIDIDIDIEDCFHLAQKLAAQVGGRCDVSSPILDAWLHDGSRVHVVLPPIAPHGPCITIRRFLNMSFEFSHFVETDSQHEQLRELVELRRNIIVAGGTSSGKTTLLNCFMNQCEENERVISIEETKELHTDHTHWVSLIARESNSEGSGKVSLGELVKASLRMRPDRIIVGEVRSHEAFDLIQALNTGHDGSMCTVHANGPVEVVHRLASLAMLAHPGLEYDALIRQIVFGIDVIVYVARKENGFRKVESINEVSYQEGSVAIRSVVS